MTLLKNIEPSKPVDFDEMIECHDGQIESLTLAQTKGTGLTLFGFGKDEKVGPHAAQGDALVYIKEGKAQVTIADEVFEVGEGGFILMPKDIQHQVLALTDMKMILILVKEV